MAGTPGVELVREKLTDLSSQKAALAHQLSEIDDYIANVPTAKAARSVVEKGMGDFIAAWKRGTPGQQKKLVARLFMRLRVTAQGLGVRYQWTSPDQSKSMTPETKKALDDKSRASNSNLIFLEKHHSGNSVPRGWDNSVKNASTAKIGRVDNPLEERPIPHEIIEYISSRLLGLLEKAAPLYQNGTSLQKIADEMQVAKSSVRNALLNGGVRIRPYNGSPEGRAAIRKRRAPGPNAPYGYAYLDGKLTVHPKEIQNVRRIVQLRKAGLCFSDIAKDLNAKSIAPRNAKQWDHSTISNIVRRESDESLKQARGED